MDNKFMEVNEMENTEVKETEAMEETNMEPTVVDVKDVPKKHRWSFVKWFNSLKWWQKALVIAGGVSITVVGGKVVFDFVKGHHGAVVAHEAEGKAIVDALQNAVENAPVDVPAVDVPFDQVVDAAVDAVTEN